jgi:hypothetical protein
MNTEPARLIPMSEFTGGNGADELISVTEARRRLGISPVKMRELIKKSVLSYERDPLDGRVKLISAQAVESLLRRSQRKTAA